MRQVVSFLVAVWFPVLLFAQQADTLLVPKDTTLALKDTVVLAKDTIPVVPQVKTKTYFTVLQSLLTDNWLLNTSGKPVAMLMHERQPNSGDTLFYLLFFLVAILAFFRFFYSRYFNTLFRVFFNTSLRQSQLTDQLLQAKLPSLFFNILFAITGGLYAYFLLRYFNWVNESKPLSLIAACALCMAIVYFTKYLTLKFTGWVTGYKEVTNTYIFIIFLINKILGILLIPFIIIMAFSSIELIEIAAVASLLLTGLMFLLRFFRSYGLLQGQLKISRFHFLLYLLGIEIIPLLLMYKSLVYFVR